MSGKIGVETMPIVEAENSLTDELVAEKLAWVHRRRPYLISIDTEIHQDYEKPSTVKITFTFLKKAQETLE